MTLQLVQFARGCYHGLVRPTTFILRLATPGVSVDSLSHRRHKVRWRLVVRKILIFDGKTKSFHFARRKLLQNRQGCG